MFKPLTYAVALISSLVLCACAMPRLAFDRIICNCTHSQRGGLHVIAVDSNGDFTTSDPIVAGDSARTDTNQAPFYKHGTLNVAQMVSLNCLVAAVAWQKVKGDYPHDNGRADFEIIDLTVSMHGKSYRTHFDQDSSTVPAEVNKLAGFLLETFPQFGH